MIDYELIVTYWANQIRRCKEDNSTLEELNWAKAKCKYYQEKLSKEKFDGKRNKSKPFRNS